MHWHFQVVSGGIHKQSGLVCDNINRFYPRLGIYWLSNWFWVGHDYDYHSLDRIWLVCFYAGELL